MQEKILLEKVYSDEALMDIGEDVSQAIFSGESLNIPDIEHGFRRGSFKVTIVWMDDITAED